jgi:hypothetical protein
MKFCAVVPEICRGQVHGPRKERKKERKRKRIIITIIIRRNGAKTISLQTLFGRLNYIKVSSPIPNFPVSEIMSRKDRF